MRLLGVIVFGLARAVSLGQPPAQEEPNALEAIAQIDRLTAEIKKLGEWETQYQIIDDAMESLWSRNQWTSQADLFAREALTEVAKIPPWEFDRRIDRLSELVGQRYALTPPKRAAFKSTIYRESFGLLWANGPVLFQQTREYVGMRLRGEPLTAEKVAEWVRQGEGMMTDWRARSDRLVQALGETVDEDHRQLFEEDFESFNRRTKVFDEMRESWAKGGWKPEDWGLQNDPIQNKARLQTGPSAPGFSAAELAAMQRLGREPAAHLGYDPSTWEKYVRGFISLYGLDAGQTAAAESILAELLARAVDHLKLNAVRLAEVPLAERGRHERFAVIRGLFEELKIRLARIPRQAQIRALSQTPQSAPTRPAPVPE